MQLKQRKGLALVIALGTMVVLTGIGALLFARTISEMRHSADDAAIVQTLMLARGAANVGGALLSSRVRDELQDIILDTADTSAPWAYTELENVAEELQSVVDRYICGLAPTPDGASAEVQIRIHFRNEACRKDLPEGVHLAKGRLVEGSPRGAGTSYTQTYALPFVLVAEAKQGKYERNLVTQGELRFTLGRASFARWALFTNVHALPNGTGVWFTDRTLFNGPVHTNNYFRFYRQAWFGDEVTSAGCTNPGDAACNGYFRPGARFYGSGFISDTAMTPSSDAPSYTNNYGIHAPQFSAGVDWRASFIELPVNNTEQRDAAKSGGIYVDDPIEELSFFVETDGGVKYQRIDVEVCTRTTRRGWCWETRTDRYRFADGGYLERLDEAGDWQIVTRDGNPVSFNGVIFSEGKIKQLRGPDRSTANDPDSAPPAIADFAQITVAASEDIYIQTDLKYEDRPCSSFPERNSNGSVTPAVCDNLDARNVLGIYSQDGNVYISEDAPQDIFVDAILMSARGVVTVERYDSIPPKGYVNLTGGIIEYYYGAFGTFNARTGTNRSGYGRRFTYDERMRAGLAPPFFPTTKLDEVKNIRIFSYGQREQVY